MALVNKAQNVSSNLQVLEILRERLCEAVINKELAFITIESPIMTYVSKIYIDDYVLDEENLYLSRDFEFNLKHSGIEIEHDDMYEEHFILIHNEMKVILTF
jgi:hypothetical protein